MPLQPLDASENLAKQRPGQEAFRELQADSGSASDAD